MSRRTSLIAGVVSALLGAAVLAAPAGAEAIVFETHDVRSGAGEHAAIDIPTGYTRHKVNPHRWLWAENVEGGIHIGLDLSPRVDTVRELRAERAELRETFGADYRELDFTVNGIDNAVRARWVFTYHEAHTGDREPYVSAYLLRGGNRVLVVGRLSERDLAKRIRHHVLRTISFPS